MDLSRPDVRMATVNQAQGAELIAMFLNYPTLRICRDLLHQYIFERALLVEGTRVKQADMWQDDAWQALAGDMLDQAMSLGFTVVRAKSGGTLPSVVPWSMCRVTVMYDAEFRRVLTAYPTRMSDGDPTKPLPHVAVLDVFGHSPTDTGVITSVVSPLASKIRIVEDQYRCMLAADNARARPPVLTEMKEDAVTPAEEVQYDYYADAMSLERNEDNMYIRNQQAVDTLDQQRNSMSAINVQESADALRARANVAPYTCGGEHDDGNVTKTAKRALQSVVPLPMGQRVSRGPDCGAPDIIVERVRFIEQEIFVTMGVPRSFCMHDITVRHDAGMLHCTLTRTVHKWQRSLSTALSYLYNLTFSEPVKWTRKRRRTDIAEWLHEDLATVRFEPVPRITTSELTFAYDKGILTWQGYRRQLAALSGFADGDLCPKSDKDPWSKMEKLMALTGQKPKQNDEEWSGR